MNSMRRQNYCGAFRKNFQRMRLIQRSPSAPFSSLCLFQIPHQFSTDTTLILPTFSAPPSYSSRHPLFSLFSIFFILPLLSYLSFFLFYHFFSLVFFSHQLNFNSNSYKPMQINATMLHKLLCLSPPGR